MDNQLKSPTDGVNSNTTQTFSTESSIMMLNMNQAESFLSHFFIFFHKLKIVTTQLNINISLERQGI